MQVSKLTTIETATIPKDCPSFTVLIARVKQDDSLSPTRARDMVSGLRRVAWALGRPESDVFCDPKWLQPRLEKISPAALNLTPKSWQNAVSNARAAMAHCGIVRTRNRNLSDLSPSWKVLWEIVLASKDPTLAPALGRFVYFLSAIDVAPQHVSDCTAAAYRKSLELNEISKKPETAHRAAVNGWNLAARRIDAWPKQVLTLQSRAKIKRLDPSLVSESFTSELAAYLARRQNPDLFSDGEALRQLRPESAQHYRRLMERLLALLVTTGIPVQDIQSLADLVRPDRVEAGLRRMLAESHNKSSNDIAQTAFVLVGIARAIGMDEQTIARLANLSKRVAVPRQTGLTPKNRERLRALQDDRRLQALLNLPERIWSETLGKELTFSQALRRETALAILIMLFCPIRSQNLAEIHIEKHLHRPGDGRVFLVFAAEDVKNRQPIEFELPRRVVRLIDKHLASRPASLCPAGTPWLFPRRDGSGPVRKGVLADRVSDLIWKETGLKANAHLFRHLAVMLLLEAHPGSYESAKRLLGHTSTSHTISIYSGMETTTVTRIFADLIERKRGKHP
jgi:integrase